MTVLLWVIAIILVGVGVAGVVLPAIPGTILIVVGLVIAASADGFTRVGVWTLVLIGAIGAASYTVDFVAAALGASRLGASRRAVVGAALGTLLGVPLGLPGLIFGPLIGAVVGELTVHNDWRRAGQAGLAAWLGFAIGTAVKIAMAFSMIAIFLAALFLF
jgi:uncharacterized protein